MVPRARGAGLRAPAPPPPPREERALCLAASRRRSGAPGPRAARRTGPRSRRADRGAGPRDSRPALGARAPSPGRGSPGRVGGARGETGGVQQADGRARPGRRRASGRAGGGRDSRGVGRAAGDLGPAPTPASPRPPAPPAPLPRRRVCSPATQRPFPPPPARPQVGPRGCGRRWRGAAAAWGRGRDSSSPAASGVAQPGAHSPLCPRPRLGQPGAGSSRPALPTGVGGGPGRAARDWGGGAAIGRGSRGLGDRREFAARDGGKLGMGLSAGFPEAKVGGGGGPHIRKRLLPPDPYLQRSPGDRPAVRPASSAPGSRFLCGQRLGVGIPRRPS